MSQPQITIYSKPDCPQCEQVRTALEMRSFDYKEISLEDDESINNFKAKFPEVRSVPQVVIDGALIGGKREFRNWLIEY